MTRVSRAVSRSLIAVLCTLALVAVWACGGGGSSPTPTPTPTEPRAAISPAPSGTAIDFAEAERRRYEGDFEGALAIYAAAVEEGTEDEQQRGLWETAQIQATRGDNRDAEDNLETLRAMSPDAEADRQALLLLGSVEFAQGDLEEARQAFGAYLETDGPAAPYAHLYLAQIDAADENGDAAITRIEEALRAELPEGAETEALFALADHYEDADDLESAAATLQRITRSSSAVDAAEALWRLGNAEAERGNEDSAQLAFRRLIKTYPAFARALDALNTEQAAADPNVTTFDRAYLYFLQRLNDQAFEAFQGILQTPASDAVAQAEARYYLGIVSERYGLYDDALIHYNEAIELLPPGLDDPLRGQAMWDRATVLERQGDIDGAIEGYAAVGDVPGAERAGEGTFRAGLLAYNLDRVDDAITHWTSFSRVAPNAEELARAHYWLGVAYEPFNTQQAASQFEAAAEAGPLDYYGLVASGVTGPAFEAEAGDPPGGPADIEAWLTENAGPEDEEATSAFFGGEQWQRAIELHESGLDDRADDELDQLLEDVTGDSWLLYRFTERVSELGRPWISTLGAQRLVLRYDDPPPALLRLVYPREYWDLVQEEAAENGFDPYYTLAMIRQESLYYPRAVSIADAMGLTQVIPDTADFISDQLGEEDFTLLDLFRPNVSIRFGAYYFGTQLEAFGGNARAALAAYNGGPGNAGTWLQQAGGDTDVFVETITFTETRAYVELVLENYALYRYAWGETTRPALAE